MEAAPPGAASIVSHTTGQGSLGRVSHGRAAVTTTLQIDDVPDDVHRELVARVARAGISLSEFLLPELERLVASRSVDDLLARRAARVRPPAEDPMAAVRAERYAR